jgi:anti-sigma B factor antagonist
MSATPKFEIDVAAGAGLTTVTVRGELDIATAERLEAVLSPLGAEGAPVVVELSECVFVDSTGLRAILSGAGPLPEGGGFGGGRRLAVAAPSAAVRRVFDISGIGALVPVFDTREHAVAAVNNGAGPPGRS